MKRKAIKQSIIVKVFVMVCALAMAMTALADGGVPRITFVNEAQAPVALYVSKAVENADPEHLADPDQAFTFTLALNGEPAREAYYELYDTELQRIGTDGYTTSFTGSFTLLAGQMAKFPDVSAGDRYEVTEAETEHFLQKIPAEGTSAKGTLGTSPASVKFVNLYVPASTPSDFQQETRLIVSKSIVLPSGFSLPADRADDIFSFALVIDGEAYADETYTVKNEDGTDYGTFLTGADGGFTLKAGQTAEFSVLTDQLYEVRELLPDGSPWRVVGAEAQTGVTALPMSYAGFTNAMFSFAVEKSMKDSSVPDDLFEFELRNGKGEVMDGVGYYIYDTYTKVCGEAALRTTDGVFSMKAGQTALFYGIASGESIRVKEKATTGYVQLVPTSADGYVDYVVSDASLETLTFVNEQLELDGRALIVKKDVSILGEGTYDTDTQFTFILTKDGEPVTNRLYSVLDGTETMGRRTGEDGSFTLKAGQTAVFEGIETGTYQVTEDLGDPENGGFSVYWTILRGGTLLSGEKPVRKLTESVTVKRDEPAEIVFTNQYDTNRTELPDTGGLGTAAYYVGGALLICAAGVLIILKRKKSA